MSADDMKTLRSRLDQTVADLARAAEKRTKLDAQVRDLEEDRDALVRSLRLIGADVGDLFSAPATSHSPASRRLRMIDAIMLSVAPGEEVEVREIVRRLRNRSDITLNAASPGSTVSTALSRAQHIFKPIRKGLYKRVEETEKAPPHMNGNGADSLDQTIN